MGDNSTQIASIETAHHDDAIIRLWQTMGAHKLANQIVASLGAQSIRALEMVRDEKLYLAAGHDTFDGFLDSHRESPMSYEAFRRRSNLLNSEGDVAFDLLNSLSVPLSQRKLLAGHIEVSENEIKIGDATTRLDDGPRIVELISKLHLKTLEQQRTNDRLSKKLTKGAEDFEKLKRRQVISDPDGTDTGQALLAASARLSKLEEVLEDASDEEKKALQEPIFQLMNSFQFRLSAALGVISKDDIPSEESSDDLGLTDEEAADLLGE